MSWADFFALTQEVSYAYVQSLKGKSYQHHSPRRRHPMHVLKNGHSVIGVFVLLCLAIAFLGCATTSQMQALEEKTQQALETAEKALKDAQSAKAGVEDSARYSREAAAGARRAENAASRAEKAAIASEASADRAERMAKKSEDIFNRLTAK